MKIHPTAGNSFIVGLILIALLIVNAAFVNPWMLTLLIPISIAAVVFRKSVDNWIKTH